MLYLNREMGDCPTIDVVLATPKPEWKLLGKGGQGTVYKIGDYVLKIIDLKDDVKKRQAFQIEKEILEELDSNLDLLGFLPQLCSIEESEVYGQYRGYILQRYEETITLQEYMKDIKQKMKKKKEIYEDEDEAKISFSIGSGIIRNLLRGLLILHKAGYIHRDIKPENILIRKDEFSTKPIFIDFGLACKLPCENVPLAGTLDYMPSNFLPRSYRNKGKNPFRVKTSGILPFTTSKKLHDNYAMMLIFEELLEIIDFSSGTDKEIKDQMKFKEIILKNILKIKKDIAIEAAGIKGEIISNKYERSENTRKKLQNLNTSVRNKVLQEIREKGKEIKRKMNTNFSVQSAGSRKRRNTRKKH